MTDNTDRALLSCPFCLGACRLVVGFSIGIADHWAVECSLCESSTKCFPSQDEAAALWNKRASSSEGPKVAAALKSMQDASLEAMRDCPNLLESIFEVPPCK